MPRCFTGPSAFQALRVKKPVYCQLFQLLEISANSSNHQIYFLQQPKQIWMLYMSNCLCDIHHLHSWCSELPFITYCSRFCCCILLLVILNLTLLTFACRILVIFTCLFCLVTWKKLGLLFRVRILYIYAFQLCFMVFVQLFTKNYLFFKFFG